MKAPSKGVMLLQYERRLRGEQGPFLERDIPVVISDQHSRQLDVMSGVGLILPHCGRPFLDHVQQHLGELGILIEIDKIWQVIVHLKRDSCFLKNQMGEIIPQA